MKTYNRKHLGCWIDGAYGNGHAIDKLVSMLRSCPVNETITQLISDVDQEPGSKWAEQHGDDWIEGATDELYNHTEDGLCWIWDSGDLLLEEEAEE